MTVFELVATGGTFDIIHVGHKSLLAKAFELSNFVIIGLSSDEFAKQKGKEIINKYEYRFNALTKFLKKFEGKFKIHKLENDFGPAVLQDKVQALITSSETQKKGELLNKLRLERGISQVEIIPVNMILAEDGNRISTTRIRNSEIDVNGNILKIDK